MESITFLNTLIGRIFEKAIGEPTFADMYANLCLMLSHKMTSLPFLHIFRSDEEEFFWSADVSHTDEEVVGPLGSKAECMGKVFDENQQDVETVKRGETVLELVEIKIVKETFVKIMREKEAKDDERKFFVVYMSLEDCKDCGQSISQPFGTEADCRKQVSGEPTTHHTTPHHTTPHHTTPHHTTPHHTTPQHTTPHHTTPHHTTPQHTSSRLTMQP